MLDLRLVGSLRSLSVLVEEGTGGVDFRAERCVESGCVFLDDGPYDVVIDGPVVVCDAVAHASDESPRYGWVCVQPGLSEAIEVSGQADDVVLARSGDRDIGVVGAPTTFRELADLDEGRVEVEQVFGDSLVRLRCVNQWLAVSVDASPEQVVGCQLGGGDDVDGAAEQGTELLVESDLPARSG